MQPALTIRQGDNGVPSDGLCSRQWTVQASYSNAAGSTEWVSFAAGKALTMPACIGPPDGAPAFLSVDVEGASLAVELEPLKPAEQGAFGAGRRAQMN